MYDRKRPKQSGALLCVFLMTATVFSVLAGSFLPAASGTSGTAKVSPLGTVTNHGDLTVQAGETLWINDTYFRQDGNVTVLGRLNLVNSTLEFLEDQLHKYHFTIQSAILNLQGSRVTASSVLVQPYVRLNMTVTAGSVVNVTDSVLAFPGIVYISAGSSFTMNNSVMTRITPPFSSPDLIDDNNDCPGFFMDSSKALFENSRVDYCFEDQYAIDHGEMSPTANPPPDDTGNNVQDIASPGQGVYIVRNGQTMFIRDFVIDTSRVEDPISGALLRVTYHTDPGYTAGDSITWTTTGSGWKKAFTLANHVSDFTDTYNLYANGANTISQINNLRTYLANNDTLNVTFDRMWVDIFPKYYYNMTLMGASELVAIDSFFDVDWGNPTPESRNALILSGTSRAYLYNLTVNETEVSGGDKPGPAIITRDGACAYVYRFATFNVTDSTGLPVPYAKVEPTYAGGNPLALLVNPLNNPRAEILDHMGKNLANYNIANSTGFVTIPLVSDNITWLSMPNSQFYGDYIVKSTYIDPVKGAMSSQSYVGLPAYPLITPQQNYVTYPISMFGVMLPRAELYPVPAWPQVAVNGAMTSLNATVYNSGRENATDVLVQFFDGPASGGKQIGANVSIDAVNAGEYQNVSVAWTPASAGIHNITVVVDQPNTIPEENETNNSATLEVTVIKQIDLAISPGDIAFDPAAPIEKGNKTKITVTVHNLGDVDANDSWIGIYDATIGLVQIANVSVNVSANSDTTFFAWWTLASAGDRSILAWADPAGLVNDSDRSNNQAFVTFAVISPKADLYPVPQFFAMPIINGTFVYLNATVYNSGRANATDVPVKFYSGLPSLGKQIGLNVTVPQVDTGGQALASTQWKVDGKGTLTLYVVVDPDNTIPDTNRANNTGSWAVQVIQPADLVVDSSDIIFFPPRIVVGDSTEINVTVHNTGDIDAAGVWVGTYIYLGSTVILIQNISTDVAAHSDVTLHYPWIPVTPQPYTILAWIDPAGVYAPEQDKTNNKAYASFIVDQKADLKPNEIEFSPVSPVDNRTVVYIEARIFNIGGVEAKNITVQFYHDANNNGTMDDGEQIGTNFTLASLMPGDSNISYAYWTAQIMSNLTFETHTIGVLVNPALTIPEADYTNNNGNRTIDIVDRRADLILTNMTYMGPGWAEKNSTNLTDSITINVTIRNTNYYVAAPLTDVGLWFYNSSTNNTPFKIIRGISFNVTENRTVTYVWTAGLSQNDIGFRNVSIRVNANNSIPERNSANNEVTRPFEILEPAMKITFNPLATAEFEPGSILSIDGHVLYDIPTQMGADNKTVWINITRGAIVVVSVMSVTHSGGYFLTADMLSIPSSAQDGQSYMINLSAVGVHSQLIPITVKKPTQAGLPWLLIIAVIIIAIVSVIGAVLYLMKSSKERMVECGECGALVPEMSKKCPKCGTLFEATMARCSNCKSWIPAQAKECPECGVVFAKREKKSEDTYEDKMKKEYMKFIERYRQVSQRKLGKKYSEEEFWAWWKEQPTYISFKDWLAKEEEKIKKSTVVCPSCQTINPISNANCQKCGTYLQPLAEKPEAQQDAALQGLPDEKRDAIPGAVKCIKCGEALEGDTKFCTKCGTFQGTVSEKPAVPKPVPAKVVYKKVIKPGRPQGGEGGAAAPPAAAPAEEQPQAGQQQPPQ